MFHDGWMSGMQRLLGMFLSLGVDGRYRHGFSDLARGVLCDVIEEGACFYLG